MLAGILKNMVSLTKTQKNILIHKIFVPLIMFSVIGLLWAIPLGDSLPWYLNLGVGLVIIS